MKFVWEESKREIVLREHGLDLADVCRVLQGPMIVDYDNAHSQTEDRWRALGHVGGNVYFVVYTETDEITRLITARRATRQEAQLFYEELFGEPL